jgi:ribosomal protein S18 acetylase RimI-like enzyme
VIHLQKFKAEDMFAVLKLASKVLPEQYNPTLFTYLYETCPWGLWTAHQYQRIVGFIIGVPFTDQFAKILMIGVHPTMQRKGIGSLLLDKLLTVFHQHNISIIELEVSVNNKKAIHFYQKHNFQITEEYDHFYQNGDNAYIMRLSGVH